jgi:chorismate lyase/3-hydroxybenzoate synthase
MISLSAQEQTGHVGDTLQPPQWVQKLFGHSLDISNDGLVAGTRDFNLVRATIPNAGEASALELQRLTARAYGMLAAKLDTTGAAHPIRFWNFIPRIHDAVGEGMDRYMAFNAGRFAAFIQWYGAPAAFAGNIAAATAVGHRANDLTIWCLAARERGMGIENPRQRPSYRYSSRYGPFPPIFARATLLPRGCFSPIEDVALVGGTASVRCERTKHPLQLDAQVRVTLQNLALIVRAAASKVECRDAPMNGDWQRWLGRYRELRVHYVRDRDREPLQAIIEPRFPGVHAIEWVRASLCRRDLLVEIEGLASLET